MDELSLIFDKLSINDKKEVQTVITKVNKINDSNDITNLCDNLNNLKLDNFQEEIRPIIKEKIISNIVLISKILLNKQKCIVHNNDFFIPRYIM
jgi:hypothetical protein